MSVIKAYSVWFKKLKYTTDYPADNFKLWGNPEINVHFNSKIYNGNIRYVSDLYRSDGVKLSQEDIEMKVGTQISFIEYYALYMSIAGYMKEEFHNKTKVANMTYPIEIQCLTKDKKCSRNLREIFNKGVKDIPIRHAKWNLELTLTKVDWESLYLRSRKCNLNVEFTFFNYQVLHHTVITNRKLHQFGLVESDLCEKCGMPDTIVHLLHDCKYIQPIWKDLETWIARNVQEQVECNNATAILGISPGKLHIHNMQT